MVSITMFGLINTTKNRFLLTTRNGFGRVLIIGFSKDLKMTNEQKRELAAKYLAKLAGENTIIDDLSIKRVIDVMLAFADEVQASEVNS